MGSMYLIFKQNHNMERIHKYRGWDLVNEKILPVESINFREGWISLNEGDNSLTDEFDMIILMQFTGLHDKNGKEIYEGDILKLTKESSFHKFMMVEILATVYFSNGSFKTNTTTCTNKSFLDMNSCWFGVVTNDFIYIPNFKDAEIIGNIHQHKHLLK